MKKIPLILCLFLSACASKSYPTKNTNHNYNSPAEVNYTYNYNSPAQVNYTYNYNSPAQVNYNHNYNSPAQIVYKNRSVQQTAKSNQGKLEDIIPPKLDSDHVMYQYAPGQSPVPNPYERYGGYRNQLYYDRNNHIRVSPQSW